MGAALTSRAHGARPLARPRARLSHRSLTALVRLRVRLRLGLDGKGHEDSPRVLACARARALPGPLPGDRPQAALLRSRDRRGPPGPLLDQRPSHEAKAADRLVDG